jgi:hypothetical protein
MIGLVLAKLTLMDTGDDQHPSVGDTHTTRVTPSYQLVTRPTVTAAAVIDIFSVRARPERRPSGCHLDHLHAYLQPALAGLEPRPAKISAAAIAARGTAESVRWELGVWSVFLAHLCAWFGDEARRILPRPQR